MNGMRKFNVYAADTKLKLLQAAGAVGNGEVQPEFKQKAEVGMPAPASPAANGSEPDSV